MEKVVYAAAILLMMTALIWLWVLWRRHRRGPSPRRVVVPLNLHTGPNLHGEYFSSEALYDLMDRGVAQMEYVHGGPEGWPPAYATLVPTRELKPFLVSYTAPRAHKMGIIYAESALAADRAYRLIDPTNNWTITPFVPESGKLIIIGDS